jgi:hypothetical protein
MVADPPWPRVVSCSERHFSLFLLFSQRIISERGRDPRGNPRFPAASERNNSQAPAVPPLFFAVSMDAEIAKGHQLKSF